MVFLLVGEITDQRTNAFKYGIEQIVMNVFLTAVIIVSLIGYFFISKKNYKFWLALASYSVVFILLLGHVVFDGHLEFDREATFQRDSFLIIVIIGICGMVSGKLNSLIISCVLLLMLINYSFFNVQPFIQLNFVFYLLLIIGYTVLIYFIIEMTEKFMKNLNLLNGTVLKQKNDIQEKNKSILDSIHYAKRIQSAILPSNKIVKSFLPDSFIYYEPKDIVAGDFYWMEHKEDTILFAAADCTGHGVPGALVSVLCYNSLNRAVNEYCLTDPGAILNKTKTLVLAEFAKSDEVVYDGMDIALCALNGNILKYAGAYNPLWLIKKNAQTITEYAPNREPIGNYVYCKDYVTHEMLLEEGDTIYIFTDGFTDQFGGIFNKKYKSVQLRKFLLSIQDHTMDEQRHLIKKEFNHWKGEEEQIDDICFIGMRHSNGSLTNKGGSNLNE